jgi:hypothetical protein
MALQVAGGVACCCPPPPPGGGGRRTRCRPPRAVASGAAAVVEEGEGKVRLGESGVAVTKLGIGAWSWGDTTYWNDSEWDGTCYFFPSGSRKRVWAPAFPGCSSAHASRAHHCMLHCLQGNSMCCVVLCHAYLARLASPQAKRNWHVFLLHMISAIL